MSGFRLRKRNPRNTPKTCLRQGYGKAGAKPKLLNFKEHRCRGAASCNRYAQSPTERIYRLEFRCQCEFLMVYDWLVSIREWIDVTLGGCTAASHTSPPRRSL